MRFLRLIGCLLAATLLAAPGAGAQTYPSKVIKIVIPFPPGGGVDAVGRIMARSLSEQLGQQIIVENRAGASGNIGADAVLKSDPDGYTLLISASTFVVNPVVAAQKAPFDPLTDFSYVALVAKGPLLFIVNPKAANSVKDFIARAKASPDKYNLATGGYGSAGHLAAESLKLRAGLNIPVVLYKGTGPAFAGLMGGQISGILDPLVTALPLAKGGKARALAIASPKRSPLAPDVPTFAEAGLPDFAFYTWYGLWGPGKLPPAVVGRLQAAMRAAGATAELRKWFESQGLEFSGLSGKAFLDFARGEQAMYADIARKGHLVKH